MNKTRIAARIIAGALASAVLAVGALSAPAQAADTGWGRTGVVSKSEMLKDTGWGSV